jgi:hypothetical protein
MFCHQGSGQADGPAFDAHETFFWRWQRGGVQLLGNVITSQSFWTHGEQVTPDIANVCSQDLEAVGTCRQIEIPAFDGNCDSFDFVRVFLKLLYIYIKFNIKD